jgi:regulator of protease activity HflC (stomatin/prohibitin superfamily)
MKTKSQEIEILEETIQKLTPNSYLGPWLTEVKAELQALMRADSFPCVSLAESKHHAEKIVTEAERKAETIIANAKRDANDREAAAESRIDRARMLIRDASQNLLAIEERL